MSRLSQQNLHLSCYHGMKAPRRELSSSSRFQSVFRLVAYDTRRYGRQSEKSSAEKGKEVYLEENIGITCNKSMC
jgi:hypothetical protein